MKKFLTGLFTMTVLLCACNRDNGNPSVIFTKVYSKDNISAQKFTINADKDTIIKGASGTVLHIQKNTFIDSSGQIVNGQIDIELKEAFSPADIVLCNLTTTSDEQFLQSGGMIYTNATANGKPLQIAGGKEIGIAMPTDSTKDGMQLFEGVADGGGINWKNPLALKNGILPVIPVVPQNQNPAIGNSISRKVHTNVSYRVRGFEHGKEYPKELYDKMWDFCMSGTGLVITKDSIAKVGIYTVELIRTDSIREFLIPEFTSISMTPIKGTNTFTEDPNTNYIFSIKKLGWANIDRFLSDPRTREVELITSIENNGDFKTIYVSMIVSNQKMYIPGYQKADNTFSFTHGDYEKKVFLPIGETATIMATAYKNDRPYFAIKKITISEKQTVSFKLDETTTDKLKAVLKEKI